MTRKLFLLIIIGIAAIAIIVRFFVFESDVIDRTPIEITSHENQTVFPLAYARNGFTLTWDELYFADSYYVRISSESDDSEELIHAPERHVTIKGLHPGAYSISITGFYDGELDATSAPFLFTVSPLFAEHMERNDHSLSITYEPFQEGIITGGYLPVPFSEQDLLIVYRKADGWEMVKQADKSVISVYENGYFEFFSQPTDEFVISIISHQDVEFPENVASISELPVVDGLFVLGRFQFSL